MDKFQLLCDYYRKVDDFSFGNPGYRFFNWSNKKHRMEFKGSPLWWETDFHNLPILMVFLLGSLKLPATKVGFRQTFYAWRKPTDFRMNCAKWKTWRWGSCRRWASLPPCGDDSYQPFVIFGMISYWLYLDCTCLYTIDGRKSAPVGRGFVPLLSVYLQCVIMLHSYQYLTTSAGFCSSTVSICISQ